MGETAKKLAQLVKLVEQFNCQTSIIQNVSLRNCTVKKCTHGMRHSIMAGGQPARKSRVRDA